MTMKTIIYLLGMLIMLAGFWVGYYAGFVDPESVPFAQQLFFSQDYGFINLFAPILCLLFYTLIGNALSFLVIAVVGTMLGYKIQAQGINGMAIGLALGERKPG